MARTPTFLQPYPALSAFLTAHPEILSNPSFYFGTTRWVGDWQDETPAARRARMDKDLIEGGAAFAGIMTLQTGPIRLAMLAVVGCLAIVVPVVALSRD